MNYRLPYLYLFPLALLSGSLADAQAVPKLLAPAKRAASSVITSDKADPGTARVNDFETLRGGV
jgi:hypothetical protein